MVNLNRLTLQGENFDVKSLTRADLTDRYLEWLNDPEITQHLESGRNGYSKQELIQYFENQSPSTYQIFGIFDRTNNLHIGNLTWNPINVVHNHAGLGGIIGCRNYWGKSNAFVESMRLLIRHGFTDRGFRKIYSGVSERNVPCIIASKKVGFIQEGCRKSHMRYPDGTYADVYIFGIMNPNS